MRPNRRRWTNHADARRRASWVRAFLLGSVLLSIGPRVLVAKPWPTYRCDEARRAVTSEKLGTNLSLHWTYVSPHRPKPAWPTPAEERPRMHADNALHVAASDGNVYFGSSVTNEVYAIEAASGQIAWRFYTEGPVRFAPTVAEGRLYVGSDDGHVYCLNARDGRLLWRRRLGPSDEKVIGNGRMISLWPVRTSVLLEGGTVYCGAGVFPYEGIYLCALNAKDGTVIWRNNTIGDRSHELSFGGITLHGYLLASDELLYVPTGRAMPAAFSRETGEFRFWASPGGKQGGAWALLDGRQLIAGVDRSGAPHKVGYDARSGAGTGDVFAWFPGLDMVIDGNMAYVLTIDGIYAIDRSAHAEAVRKVEASAAQRKTLGKELAELNEKAKTARGADLEGLQRRITEIGRITSKHAVEEKRLQETSFIWHHTAKDLHTLILAGDTLFAGGEEQVVGVGTKDGRQLWTCEVPGSAVGLAAAEGNLLVSTDQGQVLCFAESRPGALARQISLRHTPMPRAGGSETVDYGDIAQRIVAESGVTRGYCLLLNCRDGRLAGALCRLTDLQIVAIPDDPRRLPLLRDRFRSAGLLGSRVVVEPWSLGSLPAYFANLVVSEAGVLHGAEVKPDDALYRLLRPCGGTLVSAVVEGTDGPQCRLVRRPALEETGNWTQQYGNSQNTACSLDRVAGGPLGVLWFGEPGPLDMVERHARAQSPLSMDGRLFIEGEEVIVALDAYNGTQLWQREIPGAVRVRVDVDGGNLALDPNGLYVTVFDRCLRLDPATGQTTQVYALPAAGGRSYRWGNVLIEDGTLFGVRAEPFKQPYAAELQARHANPTDETLWAYKRSNAKWYPMANYPLWENYNPEEGSVTDRMLTGDMVFAQDSEAGKVLWTYEGRQIASLTLSVGDEKVFLAESLTTGAEHEQALSERRHLIADGTYVETEAMKQADPYTPSDVRRVVALNAKTGEKLWDRVVDLTGCCGDAMGSAYQDDVLLFFGCVGNHDAWRFRENQLAFRRIVALSASTGEVLWSRPMNYRTRPVVIENRIIIEPRACDVRTGEILTRTDPITGRKVPWEFLRPGHTCAVTSASANTLFYRSHSTAIYDLERDAGVALFGGIRPGCWINMIPAGGLVLVPEASVGCTCSFPLRCSYALARKPERAQPWTVFIGHTELDERGRVVPQRLGKPVRHLAINFGAPADMKDGEGTLWLAYPNPRTVYSANHFSNYGLKFDLRETIAEGMGYVCGDFKGVSIPGTDRAWLFTSGCQGLRRCEIPLLGESGDQEQGLYTVRLGFRTLGMDLRGASAFQIKLQGRLVFASSDLVRTDSRADEAVFCEFKNVTVDGDLIVELIPQTDTPTAAQTPLLSCIELLRQEPLVARRDVR